MRDLYRVLSVLVFALPLLATGPALAAVSLDIKTAPYGLYKLDPDHSSITFKINHLGFSHFTGRFDHIDGYINFNSFTPEQSNVNITVEPGSINLNNPKLEEDLKTDKWFDVIKYPHASFRSTRVDRTGPMTGKVTGDFSLMGIKRPLTLDVTFIGTGTDLFSRKQVLGFSAIGTFDRSDFGMSNLLPMVGNQIVLEIETEFIKDE